MRNAPSYPGDKAGRRLLWVMLAIYTVVSIGLLVWTISQGDTQHAIRAVAFPLFYLIWPLFRLLRLQPCYRLFVGAYAFIIFAFSYGCVWGGFKDDFSGFPEVPLSFFSPDKVSHFFSGFLFTIAGLCIYYYLAPVPAKPQQEKGGIAAVFGLGFSTFIAVGWEVCEMLGYFITGNDAQNHLTTGVFDTMYDLVTCLVASLVSAGAWWLFKRAKVKLFTAWVVDEFVQKNSRAAREKTAMPGKAAPT